MKFATYKCMPDLNFKIEALLCKRLLPFNIAHHDSVQSSLLPQYDQVVLARDLSNKRSMPQHASLLQCQLALDSFFPNI